MAESDTTPTGDDTPVVDSPTPDTPADTPAGDAQRVPLDRFRAVTDENRALRERLDVIEQEQKERAEAELSEIERERLARETAETQLAETRLRADTLERSQWVKDAAAMVGFADPEDAAALVALGDVDGVDTARAMVTDLAERKPHLLRREQSGPTPLGAPLGAPPVDPGDPKAALGAELLRHIPRR